MSRPSPQVLRAWVRAFRVNAWRGAQFAAVLARMRAALRARALARALVRWHYATLLR